jgi:hypothetical protein
VMIISWCGKGPVAMPGEPASDLATRQLALEIDHHDFITSVSRGRVCTGGKMR